MAKNPSFLESKGCLLPRTEKVFEQLGSPPAYSDQKTVQCPSFHWGNQMHTHTHTYNTHTHPAASEAGGCRCKLQLEQPAFQYLFIPNNGWTSAPARDWGRPRKDCRPDWGKQRLSREKQLLWVEPETLALFSKPLVRISQCTILWKISQWPQGNKPPSKALYFLHKLSWGVFFCKPAKCSISITAQSYWLFLPLTRVSSKLMLFFQGYRCRVVPLWLVVLCIINITSRLKQKHLWLYLAKRYVMFLPMLYPQQKNTKTTDSFSPLPLLLFHSSCSFYWLF